jgi:hypothetical protein
MDSMLEYFEYRFYTSCVIPEIRILGTKVDWIKLKDKANKLIEIIPELNVWLKNGLDETMNSFIGKSKIFEIGYN